MFESDEHRELFEANHTAPPEKVDVGGMASANTVLNGMWTMNGTSYDRPVYYQDPDVKNGYRISFHKGSSSWRLVKGA